MEASAGHLELALMYAQLHTFEREFYDVAGHLYVRLDEARARVATARARLNPGTNREAVAAAAAARQAADECAQALSRGGTDPAEMKGLYRELARYFHPDLASDEPRRLVRQQLMMEVTLAWQQQDMARLEVLSRIRDCGDVSRELAAISRSASCRLRERCEYARLRNTDLLRQLAGYVISLLEQTLLAGTNQACQGSGFPNLLARAANDLSALGMIREIRFRGNRSLGELFHRDLRNIDAPTAALGSARGIVSAPFDQAILLQLAGNSRDLAPLLALEPGDLQGILMHAPNFISLNDAEVQPLARFPGLEVICLSGTEITGRVFDHFPQLHELRLLDLAETSFDDEGLLRLEECIWLRKLNLDSSGVVGHGLRGLRHMTSLRDLSLYETKTTDADLEAVQQNTGLRNLNLGLTQVSDACATWLSRLRDLETINLGGTRVTDRILQTLGELPVLKEVVLWETSITDSGLDSIAAAFPALRYLDVDQTRVTQANMSAFRPARPEVRIPGDTWADLR